MIQKMTEIAEKEEKLRHLKQSNRLEELRMGLQIADEAASLMRKNGYSDDEVKSFFRSSVLEELNELKWPKKSITTTTQKNLLVVVILIIAVIIVK